MVSPETTLGPTTLYEYAPTATEIPPPYALAPLEEEAKEEEVREEEEEGLDVDDDAVQLVNVLLEMV